MSSNQDKKKCLLIIGPNLQKQGVGGVTIHVQRLRDYLDNQHFTYEFLDYKECRFTTLINNIAKAKLVHIHVSNPIFLFVLVLCSKVMGKKVLMTLHGNYGRFGRFKNWLVRFAIRLSTVPIVINEKSFEACKSFNNNIRLIPAFIPPQKEEILQDDILDLIERIHNEGKIIVSTNAYNVSFDKKGNDTYGIDFLVKFFNASDNLALIVSDPSGNYLKQYLNITSNSVYFIGYPHPYYELLKHVDYFVRNTSTDGDALSVKEALYLGVPVLCSDVVDRPLGVRLFKYSDKESFEKALNMPQVGNKNIENGALSLLEIYKRLTFNISVI